MRVDAGVQVNSIDVVYMIGSTVGHVATSTIRHIAKRFHAGLIRTAQSIRSAPAFTVIEILRILYPRRSEPAGSNDSGAQLWTQGDT